MGNWNGGSIIILGNKTIKKDMEIMKEWSFTPFSGHREDLAVSLHVSEAEDTYLWPFCSQSGSGNSIR